MLLTLGQGTGDITASTLSWFEVYVPSGMSLMTVELEPYNGQFDLFFDTRRVSDPSAVTSADNKLNFIRPVDTNEVYAFPDPVGYYTLIVSPLLASGAFELMVDAGQSEIASASPVCTGDICSLVLPLVSADAGGTAYIGSEFGARVTFPIQIEYSGRITAKATWMGSANELALILNGPRRPELLNPVAFYARRDGVSPLSIEYWATDADVARGTRWQVRLVNFHGGTAQGSVEISYPRAPAPLSEDCLTLDYAAAQVQQVSGRWKIVVGNILVMDFDGNETEARQSLSIIKYYRMNRQCFVGRPDPSMTYFLVNGQAPTGSLSGEDCLGFDPSQIEVTKVGDAWSIIEGNHWIMNFGSLQDEANTAYRVIQKYGFDHICYVGRPDPSMTYFRR